MLALNPVRSTEKDPKDCWMSMVLRLRRKQAEGLYNMEVVTYSGYRSIATGLFHHQVQDHGPQNLLHQEFIFTIHASIYSRYGIMWPLQLLPLADILSVVHNRVKIVHNSYSSNLVYEG
ncbi:hypothetical protein AKJ16_DCAP01074, partial [Drosera capensis]